MRLSHMMSFAVAALAASSLSCGPGASGAATSNVASLRGSGADMWVTSDEGELPIYEVDGKHYLLGVEGRRYQVWIANRSERRLEAVLSVDGRDVISGREADYRVDRGYVLEPGEELAVEGFRKSFESVASFEFAAPSESYATRMGDGSNVGVIGLALFEEGDTPGPRPAPIAAGDRRDRYSEGERQAPSSGAYPGAGASKSAMPMEEMDAEPGLGTKYGDEIGSQAEVVPFVRGDRENPDEILALYYDDRAGLEALGIVIPDDGRVPADLCSGPNPFPGVECDTRFAPEPQPLRQK
jgi:hypothetical protein